MSAGRIGLDEYDDRSARVTAVKTRAELFDVFGDLPQPHPQLRTDPAAREAPQQDAERALTEQRDPAPAGWMDRPLAQRLTAAAVPLSGIVGVVLFFVTGWWWWFLLPAAVIAVGSRLWGQEWDDQRRRTRHGRRQERLDDRRARRREPPEQDG